MGDVVALVEKAAETIDAEKARAVAEKMRKGAFDLSDLREQLAQMEKIGGIGGILGMLPGVARMKDQIASANLDEKVFKRQKAIIDSMTTKERRTPDLLKASRKKRIAAGSGTEVQEINRLLKMHRQMADMMKAMGGGKRGALAGLGNMLGMGARSSPEAIRQMAEKLPLGAGGQPPNFPGAPGALPGLGGKLPGLGGPPAGLPKSLGKKK
jgi:signal recognition particle subunit SRP54